MILIVVDPKVLILGGAAIFSIFVFFIILFILQHQRRHHRHLRERIEIENGFKQELLKTQLETQEQTFHQISEELHDNIGQLLSSTRILLSIAQRSISQVPDALNTADQTVAKAIQDLRMLSKSLNKEWLSQFNLPDNLQAEVDRLNMSRTVLVTFRTQAKSLPLDPESQVMLFRIIQEAIQNSIKHSEADSIGITITVAENIAVSIRDTGRGYVPSETEKPKGIGILNMNHRTNLLGGNIIWNSPGNGTEVIINLPIQNQDR